MARCRRRSSGSTTPTSATHDSPTWRESGMVNVGQLVRQTHGEAPGNGDGVALVGFGTHHGTVIAGEEWGAPMQRMHMADRQSRKLGGPGASSALPATGCSCSTAATTAAFPDLDQPVDHRAIGVVYRSGRRALGQLRSDDHPSSLRCVSVHRRDASSRRAAHAGHCRDRNPGDLPERHVGPPAADGTMLESPANVPRAHDS